MKFNITTSFVALTFLPAIIAAPLTRRSGLAFTNGDYQGITVGTPLTIGWSGNEGAVTITLKSGSADNLETVGTVAAGIWPTSTSYTPTTAGTYAFEISDASGTVNYSPQFYVSPALARRSTIKDAALYLPRLFDRSLTSLSPRGSKTKTQGKDEPLAMGPYETTPCWTHDNVGGIPDICLSPSGKTYIYAKEQDKELAALWTARYNNLQHGPIKGTKEYVKEEEREKKGVEKRRNMNPTLPTNRKMREDKKDASEWSERFHNLMYGPVKGSEEYKKEEEREGKKVEARKWRA